MDLMGKGGVNNLHFHKTHNNHYLYIVSDVTLMNKIDEILSNSLFYPACGDDGLPVKYFNEHFAEYGIDTYVYVDYAMCEDRLKEVQDGFRHYHVIDEKDLGESDLVATETDYKQYASVLTAEEITRQEEIVYGRYIDTINPFARLIEYVRNDNAAPSRGPEHFSLLYIGAEAVATYAALYRTRGIAPKAIAIIAPGTGFGGNYTDFYDPGSAFMKLIRQGMSQPEYILFGYDKVMGFDDYLNYARGATEVKDFQTIIDNTMKHNMDSVLDLPYLDDIPSKKIILDNTPRVFIIDEHALEELGDSIAEYRNILHVLRQKKELNRDYISSLYSNSPFHEAVFATLIWGGLNRANLNRFLEENIETIDTKIQDVKNTLKQCDKKDIESAFNSMLNGRKNHINGVGVAFFTKILYFLSADIDGIRPLIFDKWTQTIHAVSLPEDGKDWYVLSKTENGTYNAPKFKTDSIRSKAYLDFVTKMHNLSKQIGVPSGRIEEYLFGCSKKFFPEKWNDNNPRKKLVDYVVYRPSCRIILSDRNRSQKKGAGSNQAKRSRQNGNYAKAVDDSKDITILISELKEKYAAYHFVTGTTLPTGKKSIISCEIADGIVLAIGEQENFIYCGIYTKVPNAVLPYKDEFDKKSRSRRYKYHYKRHNNQIDDAVKQFCNILDAEIARKSNQ